MEQIIENNLEKLIVNDICLRNNVPFYIDYESRDLSNPFCCNGLVINEHGKNCDYAIISKNNKRIICSYFSNQK